MIFWSVNLALSIPRWNSLIPPWPISVWDRQQITSLMLLKLNGTMEIQSLQQVKSSLLNEVYMTSWFDLTASPVSSPSLIHECSLLSFMELLISNSQMEYASLCSLDICSCDSLFSTSGRVYVYSKEQRLWSETASVGILAPHFLVFNSPVMLVTISTFQGYYKD